MSVKSAHIKLVVGLGNPGSKYDETRHNAGFWFLDQMASRYNGTLRPEKRFSGEFCKVQISGRDVLLLKPSTFMNLSGQSIQAAASYYKVAPEEVLVIHDELDLPPGTIRIKQGGGHGGHNGLRDTIARIGKEFWRVRLGIGHPGHKDAVVSYVLKRATKEDQALIDDAIYACVCESENLLGEDLNKAIQNLHSRKP